MKRALYFLVGAVIGSLLAWGGLIFWAAGHLVPEDSLFDRSRDALNLFLLLWAATSVACGGLAAWFAGWSKNA